MDDRAWLSDYEGQATAELLALEGAYGCASIMTVVHMALGQKAHRVGEENLTDAERVVYDLESLDRAVRMDGYHLGLFINNAELVANAASSLRAIGAENHADITEAAIAVLRLEGPLTAHAVMASAQAIGSKAEGELDELDREYFADPLDLCGLLLSYVRANVDQITLP